MSSDEKRRREELAPETSTSGESVPAASEAEVDAASESAWDVVDQASWESFPASDPPGYVRGMDGQG